MATESWCWRAAGGVVLSFSSTIAVAAASAQSAGATSTPTTAVGERAPANTGLDEIVVTARKRTESLINVPVAVTALGPADLQRNAASDLSKIAEIAPQVQITKTATGGGATLIIRGIGSSPLDPGIEQSVSVNLDGVQISRGRIITQAMFDLQQVEILKGPQALFFGKNSPAGVISVTSAGPGDHLEGYARVGYEFDAHEWVGEGAVSTPLTDTLGVRLAGRYSRMDGWLRNYGQPQAVNIFAPGFPTPGPADRIGPKTRDLAGRLTIAWSPTSDFHATLKVTAGHIRNNGEGATAEPYCRGGVTVPTSQGVPIPSGDCALDDRKATSAVPSGLTANFPGANNGVPYGRQTNLLASLNLDYRLGDVALTSVSGYYRYRSADSDQFDQTVYAAIYDVESERSHNFSQELRATSSFSSPINFTVGLYYESNGRVQRNAAYLGFLGLDPTTGRYYAFDRSADNSGKAYSAFAQLRWTIVDGLELAGGARYTHETKHVSIGNTYVHPVYAPYLLPEGVFIRAPYKDDNVSPEVTLSYHPTPSSTLYAAYRTGYKSGGFSNSGVLSANYTAASISFKNEAARGGEIGYKAELLDRRLRIETAAYSYDFTGLQLSSYDAPTTSLYIKNAAKARTRGFEGSIDWRATAALRLRGAIGYNRAKFLSFPNAQCYPGQTAAEGCVGGSQDLSGRPLPHAPRWVFNGGASYDTPFAHGLNVGLTGDVFYSSSYLTQEDEHPLARQKSFARVNASVRIYPSSNGWEVALIGKNLFDKRYIVASNDKPFGGINEFTGFTIRPREVFLQATYRF